MSVTNEKTHEGVERAGPSSTSFPVSGMSCQACAATVEKLLLSIPEVEVAEANFGARAARIECADALPPESSVHTALRRGGYGLPAGALGSRSVAEDAHHAGKRCFRRTG